MTESDLFREVQEEVRKERYEQLAKRLAPYAAGVVLAVAIVVGGWLGWQAWQRSQAEADARAYVSAVGLVRDGKPGEGADALAVLAAESTGGYRTLALLQRAAALESEGHFAAAAESYRQLAADGGAQPQLRAVARLRAALAGIASGDGVDRVRQDIGPLLSAPGPFRPLAAEVEALALLQAGEAEQAATAFKALAEDAEAPQGVRVRAREALLALGRES